MYVFMCVIVCARDLVLLCVDMIFHNYMGVLYDNS